MPNPRQYRFPCNRRELESKYPDFQNAHLHARRDVDGPIVNNGWLRLGGRLLIHCSGRKLQVELFGYLRSSKQFNMVLEGSGANCSQFSQPSFFFTKTHLGA